MDNQGITAQQIAMMQAQQQRDFGLGGLLGSTGSGIFGPPLLPASRYKRRPSSLTGAMEEGPYVSSGDQTVAKDTGVKPEDAYMAKLQCASVRRRFGKPKDYSEHLTRKDEKILPIDKR